MDNPELIKQLMEELTRLCKCQKCYSGLIRNGKGFYICNECNREQIINQILND